MLQKLLWSAVVVSPFLAVAAQAPLPGQARSQGEYDAYLDVMEAASPESGRKAAASFLSNWKQSELRGAVAQKLMEDCIATGDRACAISAARESLRMAPRNLEVLAAAANLLANQSDDPAEWSEAEKYARSAIEVAGTVLAPKTVGPDEWARMIALAKSSALGALGLIFFKRNRTAEAIRHFEDAAAVEVPDPAVLFRLATLYRMEGRDAEARRLYERLARTEEGLLRQKALQELER